MGFKSLAILTMVAPSLLKGSKSDTLGSVENSKQRETLSATLLAPVNVKFQRHPMR